MAWTRGTAMDERDHESAGNALRAERCWLKLFPIYLTSV